MIAVVFFTAVAIFCRTSAENVSTSLLLPNALFPFDQPFAPPPFVGQVTVLMSTTYYTLDCFADGALTYFAPQYGCNTAGGSYSFAELSASTEYVYESVFEVPYTTGATPRSEDDVTQTLSIDCGPLGTSNIATCTTTIEVEENISTNIEPSYNANLESSIYPVVFTTAVGYGTTSSTITTTATPSPIRTAATATTSSPRSSSTIATTPPRTSYNTTANSFLSPSSKVGIGLGVPLGACALAGLALLLYRHGKHKERSRMRQMENLAPTPAITTESDAKRMSEAAVMGRQPPVYSMEMQG